MFQVFTTINEWVRVQVAEALGKMGDATIAKLIAYHLESEEDDHVRATLVKTLGLIGDKNMLPVITLYLQDKDSRVRANGVEALMNLGLPDSDIINALMKLIGDPSNRVRANTALGLACLGEKKGREILIQMLETTDEFMRASATYAIGELAEPEDSSKLLEILGDSSWLVRKNAVKALVKLGVRSLPGATDALSSPNTAVRLGALEVISELGDSVARQAVIPLLEDESGEVRSMAEAVLDRLSSRG
ncbi:HEAT repeat domain-containing protein [bacterium]|nr:HEAT repeat domain-containing protein [bacterium]